MCIAYEGYLYNTCIVCAYAPTNNPTLSPTRARIQKDTFYDELDATLEACPKHDAKGANIDSDHYIVVAKIRARISRTKSDKPQNIRGYNTEALKSREKSIAFSARVTQQLQEIRTDTSVEELWKMGAAAITSAATEVLGPLPRRPKKEWYDEDCMKAIHEKNAARQLWLGTKNTRGTGTTYKERYRDARRKAVNLCRARKRHYEDDQMRKVEH
ncbi:hypothetical protein BGY98DRAFT_1120323, partial [Russula aff. rugulosa BPL654]